MLLVVGVLSQAASGRLTTAQTILPLGCASFAIVIAST
jgi:hypothetical protein